MKKHSFTRTAYEDVGDFLYARAKFPVSLKNGIVIGDGVLYPEINFTLPPMTIDRETMPEVIRNYRRIIIPALCERARALEAPGFVAEMRKRRYRDDVPPARGIESAGRVDGGRRDSRKNTV